MMTFEQKFEVNDVLNIDLLLSLETACRPLQRRASMNKLEPLQVQGRNSQKAVK